tara:strand:- start:445 stop:621 length:177 start_codon:yes stop_codon:yes gene_type:complete
MMNAAYSKAVKYLRVQVEVRDVPYEEALDDVIGRFALGLNQIACLTEAAKGVYGPENK